MQRQGLIFVISGPSGSGKTTLLKELLKSKGLADKLIRSISLTTRPKRAGERNKKDYFFISQKEFQAERRAKKILEWTKYLGYYYATPKGFVELHLRRGRHIVLCLDLKGALKIRRLYPRNTVMIFVLPPSLDALRARIAQRCHKTGREEIKQRLELARGEILNKRGYDYCLVNKDLEQTLQGLKKIILSEAISYGE